MTVEKERFSVVSHNTWMRILATLGWLIAGAHTLEEMKRGPGKFECEWDDSRNRATAVEPAARFLSNHTNYPCLFLFFFFELTCGAYPQASKTRR